MNDSPKPRIISAGEATALVDKHDLREKLSNCEQKRQLANQADLHTANCCNITIVRYIDRDSGGLVAIEECQVYVSDKKPDVNVFTYFRIGDDEYIVRPIAISPAVLEVAEPNKPDSEKIR